MSGMPAMHRPMGPQPHPSGVPMVHGHPPRLPPHTMGSEQQQQQHPGGMSELQKLVNMQPQVMPPNVSKNQAVQLANQAGGQDPKEVGMRLEGLPQMTGNLEGICSLL